MLTDREVDRILSTRIPGGSYARDWFLPHYTKKGLENVRDVVRAIVEASDPNKAHWVALAEACTKIVAGEAETEKVREAIDRLSAAILGEAAPIDMVLHCPACGMQHIDEPEGEGDDEATVKRLDVWTNPPHRSHLCHGCGHIWRPADVPTNGVAAVQTKGKNDSPAKSLADELKGLRDKAAEQGRIAVELFDECRRLRDELEKKAANTTLAPVEASPVAAKLNFERDPVESYSVASARLLVLLKKAREREHNPFEPNNQSAFYYELSDAIVSSLVQAGGLGPVRSTRDGELPAEYTPVLVLVNDRWRIGERRWEHPGYEDTFKPYWYWDDPDDDGQGWEVSDVTAWTYLPDRAPVVVPPDPIKTQALEELFRLGYTFRDGLLCPPEKGITK